MQPITFITGNPGKAEQVSKYLGIPVLHQKIDLTEIQSLNISEVVIHKATEAFVQIGTPVLVDDTSLRIHAMGELPGVFIKFFLTELGTDGICKITSLFENRNATATVAIGLHDGSRVHNFIGKVEGTIAQAPNGEGGFGWDAVFIPNSHTLTRAAMNEQEYDATSPRKAALDKLQEYFRTVQ